MLKKMSVVICAAAVTLTTAGYASAQSTAQEAKDKTKAAGQATKDAANQAGDATSDAAITGVVKSKLLGDTKVGGLDINVETRNGVVTLTGKVNSAAERTEAIRLARTTTGVKDVVNKITLAPAATTGRTAKDDGLKVVVKDDTKETAAKVKDATKKAADKTVDATKKAGEATKNAAKKTAGAVKDTKVEVKDDTTPKLQRAGDVTADAAITSAVKTKLLGDTAVRGLKIDVDTKDNVVTLTGNVRSAAEKAEAIRLAKTTTGVKSVVDKLTIQQ
jgi:osmotically-inducible protein OsmY